MKRRVFSQLAGREVELPEETSKDEVKGMLRELLPEFLKGESQSAFLSEVLADIASKAELAARAKVITEMDEVKGRAISAEAERDAVKRMHEAAEAMLTELRNMMAQMQSEIAGMREKEVSMISTHQRVSDELRDVQAKFAASTARSAELEKQLRAKQAKRETVAVPAPVTIPQFEFRHVYDPNGDIVKTIATPIDKGA